jgi:hypothetical protein
MSEEMIDLAVSQAQWKRGELLKVVKEERARLMSFAKKKAETAQPGPSAIAATEMSDEQKSNHMIAMEEKRMLALKKRQEKEIEKMIEKETQTVELQLRLQKTEHEARQKKLEFDKKVAADKVVAAKKATQRLQERAQKEAEEVVKKKEMLKAERERAAIRKQKLEEELRRIEAEARVREIERAAKVEAKKKKTEAAIAAQFEKAEENRKIMMEREQRVREQIEVKKALKKEEVAKSRAAASKRIAEAVEKYQVLHEQKEAEFHERQRLAAIRAKESKVKEDEALKKQAADREKRDKIRLQRLVQSFDGRASYRQEIVKRRREKDKTFGIVAEERQQQLEMTKFRSDMTKKDKEDNVERTRRVAEFRRLQMEAKIESENKKFLETKLNKEKSYKKHVEEVKSSLTRKHQISDAMDKMRMTNDFSKLDELFKKAPRANKHEEEDGADPRAQTV